MIRIRKHQTDIKYIKPKEGKHYVAYNEKPLLWKFYTKHQKYNYHIQQYAFWTAYCLTPHVYDIASHLVQIKKVELCWFDDISLNGIGHIHLPLTILKNLAKLNNLKCEWWNEVLDYKKEKEYTKRILRLSHKLAKQLHAFFWNMFYYKWLEINDNEDNEWDYIEGKEIEFQMPDEEPFPTLGKQFQVKYDYWRH